MLVLTGWGMNRKGFCPKVLVGVSSVSLFGWWNTDEGPRSESSDMPVGYNAATFPCRITGEEGMAAKMYSYC